MFKALFRLVLFVVVLAAAAAFFFGYRWARPTFPSATERPIGTSGPTTENERERARAAGADIGEKVAVGANRAERTLANAALTAKIKSKMALDDTIEARRIDVDTTGSVVTLSGTVRSSSERTRAMQLARETDGVTQVIDRLTTDSAVR